MTALAVRVDTTSPVPPYEQICAQLAALILTSRLAEGNACRLCVSSPPTWAWRRGLWRAPTASWRPLS
ncbi:hypothetical protein ACWKT5_09890 [Streptomyces avermitilis]